MPRAYSSDLRERVLAAAHEQAQSHGALAARFRVGESTLRGWLRRERATGRADAKPHGGGMPAKIDAAGVPVLRALVAARPECTLRELTDGYQAATGTALSLTAVWRACRRHDLRRKRNQLRPRRTEV